MASMTTLKALQSELSSMGLDKDAEQASSLFRDSQMKSHEIFQFVPKGCGHFISDYKLITGTNTSLIYEANEFPCPLCSKASCIKIPVFSKSLREVLLKKESPSEKAPGLWDISEKLEMMNSNSQLRQYFHKCYGYPASIQAIMEQERSNLKQASDSIAAAFNEFYTMKSKTSVFEISATERMADEQDMFNGFARIVEITGFADTIKNMSQAMEGVYLVTRLKVIDDYESIPAEDLEGEDLENGLHPLKKMQFDYAKLKLTEYVDALERQADDEKLFQTDLHALYTSLCDVLVG